MKFVFPNKKYLYISAISLVIIAGLWFFVGSKYVQAANFRKLADQAYSAQNYKEAASLFAKSTKLLANKELDEKQKNAERFASYKEISSVVEDNFALQQWQDCLSNSAKIEKDYPAFSSVSTRMGECQANQDKLSEKTKKLAEETAAKAIAEAKTADEAAKAAAAKKKTAQKPSGENKQPTTSTPQQTVVTYDSTPVDIIVDGNEECKIRTYQALNVLKSKDLEDFNKVMKYVRKVTCTESGAGTGMYAWENPPRFSTGMGTVRYGVLWYAASFVHEAYHSQLYNDYLLTAPFVPDEIWTGEAVEMACLGVQYTALAKIGGSQYDLDWIKNGAATEWWKVPPEERWW